MSEISLLKEKIHLLLEDTTSEEVVYAFDRQLQEATGNARYTSMSGREEEGLRRGLEDVAAGRLVPAEEVFAKLRAKSSSKDE